MLKNMQVYRLPKRWSMTPDQLEVALKPQALSPCSSLDMQTQGWVSPRNNDKLVHTVNGQMLIVLGMEKKLLPASVINQVAKAKAFEIEEQQGYKPGRKQMREIKEEVTDELLPRAFSLDSRTLTWIDPVNGWLVVDAGSATRAEAVFRLLLKSIDKLPVESVQVAMSPLAAMTEWLSSDEAPHKFTVDQDTELRASGESKATVRFVSHTIELDDVRRHIASGKQCTRLALTWNDKISFVLTDSLSIKKVTPLDVLKEANDGCSKDADERFDSDVMLMTGELNTMLCDLVAALGGFKGQVQ